MAETFSIESDAMPAGTRVVAYDGEESLSEAFSYRVWMTVPGPAAEELDAETVLLQPGRLAFHAGDGSLRRQVQGIWASLELLQEGVGGASLYVGELVPTFWKLKLSRHSRVWANKSLKQIIADVFRKAGFIAANFDDRMRGGNDPIAHVCQYRESDYDFLSRWFEREGIYYFFEHTDAGDKLVYLDDMARQEDAETSSLRYVPETDSGASGQEGVRYFRASRSARSAKVLLTDHDPLGPTQIPSGTTPVDPLGAGELRRHLEDDISTRGGALSAIRAQSELARQDTQRAEGLIVGVIPGRRFALVEHPSDRHNRRYQCVALESHGRIIDDSGAIDGWLPQRVRATGHSLWTALTLTFDDVQFRPALKTPRPRVAGVTVAFVDGPADSEYAQLDEHGQYLVKVHLDENTAADGENSTRVRMLQPHAGAPEGWHLPLRKGTEVLLSFVGGDPDRPVITTAVPNSDTLSPVTESNHTQNVFHTGGNSRLEMEDQLPNQYIDLSTPPQNTFMHLGKHHGSHDHNYMTSTDGTGLIRTGADYNVTVGGEKYEHVHGTVLEDYDQTKLTDVTGAVDEKYHVDHIVAVTAHCQETYLATQTTNVETHTEEKCATQVTHVRAALSEQHGSQTTRVDTDWTTECASELFNTGASTQRDGTLEWNIKSGALIKAASITINGPRFSMMSRTTRTITRPDEMMADTEQYHLAGNKFEAGLMAVKMNMMVLSHVIAKIDILTGIAVEAVGFKVEDTGLKVTGYGSAAEFVGFETELSAGHIVVLAMGIMI